MKLNQYGVANGMTIGLVVVVILLIGSLVFGIWSFSGRQKYKNNTEQLINTAVASAKVQQQSSDNKTFAIAAENPLIQYTGPATYGTISLLYPKTWSSYVNSTSSAGIPVDGYFYPGTLPSVADDGNTNYALRLQVESQSYTSVLQFFNDEIRIGMATVTAFSLPKLPNVVGVKVVGTLNNGVKGTAVILPLRNQALEVWTEGTAYLNEFNNDIIPNLSFSP